MTSTFDLQFYLKAYFGKRMLLGGYFSILILKFNRYLFRKKYLLFRFTTFLIETFIKIRFLISESKEN